VKALPADMAAVCRRMRAESGVALAVHEKPDADALGAAGGMLDLFAQLGVEAKLYVDEGEALPLRELLLPEGAVVRGLPPADLPLYALDCGSFPRLALAIDAWDAPLVDIDHHHDNSRYGDLVLLRPRASSTCEIVCELAQALELTPSPAAATALYTGISFDSGHFHHNSTSAATFRCAAWLAELGVDVTAVYGELYERRSLGAVRLCAVAVRGVHTVEGGRALVATLTRADYAAAAAAEEETEGIVETLRSVNGVEAAALVKEQSSGARVRVSLRSNAVDVSAIAAQRGGGGHRLAAGFSSDDSPEEVSAWLSSELAKSLSTASS
jgi:bifunctional oligoribonuclease and PAP phosphatase NrnA